ncbi:NYN domain-containing protein [Mangrovactinospora gilvigrisea]|uniref:NYN domain-containing protein n=1 Tax=Mangrovactinospora gilvigrisea TaxID=1428644 RepID=A0A1J7BY20_9ACTN|nr:NYN domain-containing protein [Mangrovactinospora gilvigrisea]OIV38377.1 NYN domain-containing protein [Mangrovactinospora gilvigrisea]
MDRCIVLVDAGYLLGAAASLLTGNPTRTGIQVELDRLVGAIRERAEADTGLPLLRVYWFDAAPDRVPQPEHRRLRVMNRVTVKLGALTRSGGEGRWAQKGVDAAMHAELTGLARNNACSDVVLITGDGDLLPGLTAAKEHGVAVHLWAVQAGDGDYNQSEDLVAEADVRHVLDSDWIRRSISVKETVVPRTPGPRPEIAAILSAPLHEKERVRSGDAPDGDDGPPDPADGGPEPGGEPVGVAPPRSGKPCPEPAGVGARPRAGVPTPKDLAGLAPRPPALNGHGNGVATGDHGSAVLRWSTDRGLVEQTSRDDQLPTLAQLTSAAQRWADREEDITAIGGDPQEVGQVFARRWSARLGEPPAAEELLRVLWSFYPRIPHRIDGELLRYAARFGLLAHKDDQIDEEDRYAIRAGFWRELGSRPGAPAVEDGE